MTVVGSRVRYIDSNGARQPQSTKLHADYDRQTRLFGASGQQILAGLKVGIIGLGGGGSLVNEWLSRLGVGNIVAVDFDRVDVTNLARVVGATRWDARSWLASSSIPFWAKLGKRWATYKVKVAQRVSKLANPGSTPDHGSSLALRMLASVSMCGTAIATRSAPGWQWLERASRRFRRLLATRRSRCRLDIATYPRRTGFRLWNGSRLRLNRLSDYVPDKAAVLRIRIELHRRRARSNWRLAILETAQARCLRRMHIKVACY